LQERHLAFRARPRLSGKAKVPALPLLPCLTGPACAPADIRRDPPGAKPRAKTFDKRRPDQVTALRHKH